MDIESKLLTRREAADYLNVKVQTLASWACSGRYGLPVVRFGRCVRYKKSVLDEFITAHTVGGAEDEQEARP